MSGNSHQRRTANRHWRHLVPFDCYIHSESALQIRVFGNETFKRRNYGRTWAMWHAPHPKTGIAITVLALHKDKDYAWLNLMI